MREWMEVLRRPVELRRADDQEARTSASRTSHEGEVKLVKITEQDDIEAHLTTFEREMHTK